MLPPAGAASIFDLGLYNSTEQIAANFQRLVGNCSVPYILGPTFQSVSYPTYGDITLPVVQVGNGSIKIMLNFGTYGREFASADLALRLTEELCYSSRGNAMTAFATFLIVPMLNIPARQRVETSLDTSSCGSFRTNENGVDIDRNFDVNWQYTSDNPSSEYYRGSAPLSEVQSTLLTNLNAGFLPTMFIDMQMGNNAALTFPWFYQFGDCDSADVLTRLLHNVTAASEGAHCSSAWYERGTSACPLVGSSAKSMRPPYVAAGTATDYFYQNGLTYSSLWMVFAGGDQADTPTAARSSSSAQMHTVLAADARQAHESAGQGQSMLAALSVDGKAASVQGVQQRSQHQPQVHVQQQREQRAQEVLRERLAQRSRDSVVLALEGTLGNGALYDPIYDCIKYFSPITRENYEKFVARWIRAIYAATMYLHEAPGQLDMQAASAKAAALKEAGTKKYSAAATSAV